jgi:hypothetical protein
MLLFGKKKRCPELCEGNSGHGIRAKVGFSGPKGTWSEDVNLITVAEAAFKRHSYRVNNENTHLYHKESGYIISPQFLEVVPLDDGTFETTTTMQVNHLSLVPQGVFEYQHACGNTMAEAIVKGIDQWVETDFVPLFEATHSKPESCTAMQMELPEKDGQPARMRRMILGPVMHFQKEPKQENCSDEHCFCPCCMLTNNYDAFTHLIQSEVFYCIRLFALRDASGAPSADCRVNGLDFQSGEDALRKYAESWPKCGYEFRKQYIVLQTILRDSPSAIKI